MGISLNVAEYCQCCPNFEPDVKKEEIQTSFGDLPGPTHWNTLISCKNAQKCNRMYYYIKQQVKK